MIATSSYLNLNHLKLKEKFSSSFTLAMFQVLKSHMWLMGTILDSKAMGNLHYRRESYWTALPGSAV